MITLSPRLAAAARCVIRGETLADIGTDHAYLPAYLVQTGAIPRAIAGDIMPGPLEAARTTLREEGLADRIDLRLGSGLQVVTPGEAATASICGMGGGLVTEILAAGPLEGIRRLVLGPHGWEITVRRWLADHGWQIVDEEIAEDAGHFYMILAAERGSMTLSAAEAAFGPVLLQKRGEVFERYLQGQRSLALQALAGTRRSNSEGSRRRAAELEHRIRLLEEVAHRGPGDRR